MITRERVQQITDELKAFGKEVIQTRDKSEDVDEIFILYGVAKEIDSLTESLEPLL
ncbi:hypothetical protein [Spirosoma litoris]